MTQAELLARRNEREAKLISLGLKKTSYGFVFQGNYVCQFDIHFMNNAKWNEYLFSIKSQMQASNEEIVSKKIPLSDLEKVRNFVNHLCQLTGPELQDKELQNILDTGMQQVLESAVWMKQSLKRYA